MTPAEFMATVDGITKRRADERYLLAWQTSILLGAWVKDPPSPERLLGMVTQSGHLKATRDDLEE